MNHPSQKPVAFIDMPKTGGLQYGVAANDIPVFLRCRDDSMKFSWIRSRWFPGDSPKTSQLIIVCPSCAQQLRVPGHTKTFQYELLPAPVPLPIPGSPDALQVAKLSIVENMGCPCGLTFRLTDNVLHKA